MPLSPVDLRRCTLAASRLLEALGLSDFRFAIEPGGERWQVEVECRAGAGWSTLVVPFEPRQLEATLDDDGARERMLELWRGELAACRIPATEGPTA